jgi:hypothetical protein
MIPDPMPGNEIFGRGLRDRVTACRKRLHTNRVMHRVHVDDQLGQVFQETTSAVLDCCSVMRESIAQREKDETLPMAGYQEVGIT